MNPSKTLFYFILTLLFTIACSGQDTIQELDTISDELYPEVISQKPDLSSPVKMEVTLSNERRICQQLIVDTLDFPELAKKGLHGEESLKDMRMITGRSLEEITSLGQPQGLSYDGFMAEDEDVLSVIQGDNPLVRQLNLTHPQLTKPLFHVLNMMDADLSP